MADATDAQISARATLYAVERQELSSLMGHALTTIGAAVAYIGVTAAWAGGKDVRLPDALLGALAIPAWAAVFFHALINALVVSHNVSAEILEQDLLDNAGYPKAHKDRLLIGARPGRTVTDFRNLKGERLPLRLATLGANLIPLILLLVFSAASAIATHSSAWTATYLVIYALFTIVLAWIWHLIYTGVSAESLNRWANTDLGKAA